MLQHIAIIPDGNRRWARAKGLPELMGHKKAVETTLPDLLTAIREAGIKYFTFWALSPENLERRSKLELESLYTLIRIFLKARVAELHEKNVKIRSIGDISLIPQDIQKQIADAEKLTENNTGLVFVVGLNYGGRDEIIRALKRANDDGIDTKEISKTNLSNYLDTTNMPDPDLIVRTGGEQRTSGFMVWQAEYAEYIFTPEFFPDFTPEVLTRCLQEFDERERRFGK